jgi:choline dehydrogenase-like flavoprotein
MPTNGGYNPTLTILANAYRVADHFVREAKGHSL